MSFEDLLSQLKTLSFDEIRQQSGDYFEGVLLAPLLDRTCATLETYFGPPFKPAGQKPSSDAQKRSEPYGGIQKNQILYYVERDSLTHCAMLWPWGDGTRVTLKIARGTIGG